jgi:hypothetical protein
VLFFGPGSTVPNVGKLEAHQYAVKMTAHVNDEYTFARIAGLTDMHTQRSATAVVTSKGKCNATVFAWPKQSEHERHRHQHAERPY